MFTPTFEKYIFLSSLLSGFAFAIIATLISMKDDRKIVSWVIGLFSIPASALLVSAFSFSFLVLVCTKWGQDMPPDITLEIRRYTGIAQDLFFVGLITFLLAGGLIGWIRSRIVGSVTTLVSILSGVIMAYIYLNVTELFPTAIH
jgi:hypothetical protein